MLGDVLLSCLNQNFESGVLTTTQRQAVITLLEKNGKDNRFLKNWRPISLLNVDLKVLSIVLANRIKNSLQYIIHQDQSAFIKDCYIGEPLRIISDIMSYLDIKKEKGILFAADFQAAFDSLDYGFLKEALRVFGFHESFIKWVTVQHYNIESCVLNNGFSTGFFKIERGVRQGDPLAPYLFPIALEVLAAMVRQNEKIKGIKIGDNEIKMCMYADDTTFFLEDKKSLDALQLTIDSFSKFSSLEINIEKSEVAWLGSFKNSPCSLGSYKQINLTTEGIKILGIYHSYDNTLVQTLNYDKVLYNFKTFLQIWKSRNLTIFGKNEVIRSLAVSKILFVSNMILPSKMFVQKVKGLIKDFLWNSKTAKVAYKTLVMEKDQGGIGLPDIDNQILTQQIRWVQKLCSMESSPWKIIPNFYLQQIGGHYNIRSNFDKQSIPRNIPKFYRTCLDTWSNYTNKNPENINEICIQPIWNNSKILVNKRSIYIKDLDKLGIRFVNDIVSVKGKLRQLTSFANRESEEYCKYYLNYMSIVKSIPEEWKKKLQEYNTESKISISDEFLGPAGIKQICKLTSKNIYNSFYV